MKNIIALASVSAVFVVVACGTQDQASSTQSGSSNGSSSESVATGSGGQVSFSGSVNSAFAMTVDGVRYEDSEDFYTQEVLRLPAKVAAAGYSGWDARFDAVLGFNDLAKDMMVYISPVEKRGYTGKAAVGSDAQFKVVLPSDALDTSYNVRAVKRVNVVLTKGTESKKFCYNFSAVDKNVPLTEKDKPIVLDNFVTKMTLYACDNQQSDGIIIPQSL